MHSSFLAIVILAIAGSSVAAPAPGGSFVIPFSGGNGGKGGSAVSGNSGTANGGSVYTSSSGWGWAPVVVGSGESIYGYTPHALILTIIQLRAATAAAPSLAPRRVVTAVTVALGFLAATAAVAAARSRDRLATPTVARCTRLAAALCSSALVSISFPTPIPRALVYGLSFVTAKGGNGGISKSGSATGGDGGNGA